MPIVTIKMLAGRSEEVKQKLVERITEVLVETVSTVPENVSIVIEDMERQNFAKAGVLYSKKEGQK
jgi:4-oxalocrotonate tautomerase